MMSSMMRCALATCSLKKVKVEVCLWCERILDVGVEVHRQADGTSRTGREVFRRTDWC